jgi:hypothetical protein
VKNESGKDLEEGKKSVFLSLDLSRREDPAGSMGPASTY